MDRILAVYDTNVWISGLIGTGASFECLRAAFSQRVQLVYCTQMIAELAQKLRLRLGYSENHLLSVLYKYKYTYKSKQVEITGNLHIVSDPDDDMFVECAMIGGAKWVVSQDKHLLRLKEYERIQFVTPQKFLKVVYPRG